jgi:hypothetical protein
VSISLNIAGAVPGSTYTLLTFNNAEAPVGVEFASDAATLNVTSGAITVTID